MTPVIDRLSAATVVTTEDTLMDSHDIGFGHDHQTVSIDAQADRPIGEAGWYTVAVVIVGNQAG